MVVWSMVVSTENTDDGISFKCLPVSNCIAPAPVAQHCFVTLLKDKADRAPHVITRQNAPANPVFDCPERDRITRSHNRLFNKQWIVIDLSIIHSFTIRARRKTAMAEAMQSSVFCL